MAEMESIVSNPEFIKALERNRPALNAAFEYFNSGESRVDSKDIFNVFSMILNPVYSGGIQVQDKNIISIFKCLLKLISKKLLGKSVRNKDLEIGFYTIIERHKNLLAEHGDIFIINLFNSMLNLADKKYFSLTRWVSLVSSLPSNIDMDEFRKCGFISAWICGAASAGENAAEIIRLCSPEIIKILFDLKTAESSTPGRIAEIIKKDPWHDPVLLAEDDRNLQPVFKTAGGFTGYGYEFRKLPVVMSIDEYFYASDGNEVFRLYADYYGVELIRDNAIKPGEIQPGGVINRFVKESNFIHGKNSYPLPPEWKSGVTSIAFNRNTVVWTLKDSYKLYIAGIRDKDV